METAVVRYEAMPLAEIEKIGTIIAQSKLFGVKTPAEAIALCLIAQAEGKHPATAALQYHIFNGKPSLKADEMLARFQDAGGEIEYHEYTDEIVAISFSHPQCKKPIRVEWNKSMAVKAELWGKDVWKKYPRSMLRSRVISEGVRAVHPRSNQGFYTEEEVESFDTKPKSEPKPKIETKSAPESVITENTGIEDAQVVASIDTTVHDNAIDALVEELETAVNMDQLLEAWNAVHTTLNRTDADNARLKAAKDARKATLSMPIPPGIMADPTQLPDVVFIAEEKAMDEIFGAVQVKPEPKKKGRAA
jgi:hypothetical protein